MNQVLRKSDAAALESRLAARLAGALSEHAEAVPHDVSERLRFARERALTKAREARLVPASAGHVVAVSARGAAVLGGGATWWQRAASILPLLALVAGLFVINEWADSEQVQAAAEIDAQLLADDLPPAAYGDPGFAEFLRSSPNP